MSDRADVVVVGAGVMGSSIAHALCAGGAGRGCGVTTEFLPPDRLPEVEPLVDPTGLAGGAYEPDGGVVDPVKMCLSWVTAALGRGLEPRFGEGAVGIDTRGGRVVGVRTT